MGPGGCEQIGRDLLDQPSESANGWAAGRRIPVEKGVFVFLQSAKSEQQTLALAAPLR